MKEQTTIRLPEELKEEVREGVDIEKMFSDDNGQSGSSGEKSC